MSDYYFIVCQDCQVYKPVVAVSMGRDQWRLEQSERNTNNTIGFFRRHCEHELVVRIEGKLGDARREEIFENPELDAAVRHGYEAGREMAKRKQAASRNVENGWCPCGEELDSECECGISRLSYQQGIAEPLKRSSLHPRIAEADDG